MNRYVIGMVLCAFAAAVSTTAEVYSQCFLQAGSASCPGAPIVQPVCQEGVPCTGTVGVADVGQYGCPSGNANQQCNDGGTQTCYYEYDCGFDTCEKDGDGFHPGEGTLKTTGTCGG